MKPRTEGSVALGRIGLPDEEIAARAGLAREQVTRYRLGKIVPRGSSRLALQRAFGVPPDAWDRVAVVTASGATAAGNGHSSGHVGTGDLQEMIRAALEGLRATPGTPMEKMRVFEKATAMLEKLAKLSGETTKISETKILRTPEWRAVRQKVLDALRPWPDALWAVSKALDETGDNGDTEHGG